jgi:Fe-S-cluster-containing hydrogenase component 2
LDKSTGLAVNCDLCGGNPACVEYCPQGALHYVPLAEARLARAIKVAAGKGGKK